MAITGKRLLRVPQAAKYLEQKLGEAAVTQQALRAWIRQRRIDVVKVGGAVYLTPEALDAMVTERRSER
jgi:hypothetical protein